MLLTFFNFKDNDNWSSNCAIKGPFGNRGGWWFNRCTRSNLNGLNYANGTASVDWTGIYWFKFGGSKNSMKTVTMSVIPNNHCKYPQNFISLLFEFFLKGKSFSIDIEISTKMPM